MSNNTSTFEFECDVAFRHKRAAMTIADPVTSKFSRFEGKWSDYFNAEHLDYRADLPLYGIGAPELEVFESLVSFTGSRKAGDKALKWAYAVGKAVGERGCTLVCGGAMGSEAEALRGALDADGKAIIIVGSGPNVLYPRSNDELFHKVVRTGGCVISPFEFGEPPLAGRFLTRSEFIARICDCFICGEVGNVTKSGCMTMVAHAQRAGIDVGFLPATWEKVKQNSLFSARQRATSYVLGSVLDEGSNLAEFIDTHCPDSLYHEVSNGLYERCDIASDLSTGTIGDELHGNDKDER